MSDFSVDPAFESGSVAAAEWPLCHVRLQNDARFVWLILIPRAPGAVELSDLTPVQRAALMEETVRAGDLIREMAKATGRPVDKLNVAALGNVTAQLHVHVLGRRRDDPLWPDPVWGRPGAVACAQAMLDERLGLVAGAQGFSGRAARGSSVPRER